MFKRLRETYPDEEAVKHLIYSLADASEKFEAIDDPEHDLWLPYGLICRQRIRDLKTLGNRQCRSVILGALTSFPKHEIPPFLWLLIVVIVRYQVIGRGRTGVMEKVFSQLAQDIHSGRIRTAADSFEKLGPLLSDDDVFRSAFTVHQENKPSRVQYFLLELEAVFRTDKGVFSWEDYVGLRAIASTAYPAFIKSEDGIQTDEGRAIIHSIGNRILLEDSTVRIVSEQESLHEGSRYSDSRFLLTGEIGDEIDWPLNRIVMRSQFLADIASRTWFFNNTLQNPPILMQ